VDSTEISQQAGVVRRIALLLWRVAISPVSFVVIALFWCLDLGAGSIFAYLRPDLFGSLDGYPFTAWLRIEGPRAWPSSIWVHLLVLLSWLMVASLLLCTVNWFLYRRKRLTGMGEVLVHLGFLLVFSGYVIGAVWGSRTIGVQLPVTGGSCRIAPLGATLVLREIRPILGAQGEVQGDESDLELITPAGRTMARGVKLNHPLIAGATVVYPRGVQQETAGSPPVPVGPFFAVYDVHRDPGVWLVMAGAVLITLGTIWAFALYLREGAAPRA
jgi:hypothetical protein